MSRVKGKFLKNDFLQEAASGTVNGSNTAFTVSTSPLPGTVSLFVDGVYQRPTTDYSISGTAITMVAAPLTGQDVWATFWRLN